MNWGAVARGGAALASGGASEVARVVVENDADQARREEAQEGQEQRQQSAADRGVVSQSVPSPRYQLEPPFLLDTQSGRVWRYDDQKNVFGVVTRESTRLERSWERVLTAKASADLIDGFSQATKGATITEHSRVGPFFVDHVKLLDEHIKTLNP